MFMKWNRQAVCLQACPMEKVLVALKQPCSEEEEKEEEDLY